MVVCKTVEMVLHGFADYIIEQKVESTR